MIDWEDKKDILIDLIQVQNLPYGQIGKMFNCSGNNIKKVAKRLGIELKPRRKINEKETYELMKSSNIIVDVPMANQNGLTIRTFEALGFNRKLITTNKNIVNYDFYNPTNIYVYEGEGNFDFESDFFKKPYEKLPAEIKEKYSLSSFISTLLSEIK